MITEYLNEDKEYKRVCIKQIDGVYKSAYMNGDSIVIKTYDTHTQAHTEALEYITAGIC